MVVNTCNVITISPLYVEEGNLKLHVYIVLITKQVCIEKGLPSLGIAFALNKILPEVCQAVHAVWSCVYVTLVFRL